MAPMPPRGQSHTVSGIYKAYESDAESWDNPSLAASDGALECPKAIWMLFRWAVEPEQKSGKSLRRFETAAREEERIINDLARSGVTIKTRKEKIQMIGGHVRGTVDARAIGVVEAPKTEHILEVHAVNHKKFARLLLHKLRTSTPDHYALAQVYMHALGISRCLYVAVNTDDDSLYSERIDYDLFFASSLVSKLSRIIKADAPPAGICSGPGDFRSAYCKVRGPCMESAPVRTTCRSCVNAVPGMDGNAVWACERHERELSVIEQEQGCPSHRLIPELVDGEQFDYDAEKDLVYYRMKDGTIWINGGE